MSDQIRRKKKLSHSPRNNSAGSRNTDNNPVSLHPAIRKFLQAGGFSGELPPELEQTYLRPLIQQAMDVALYSHYEEEVRPCIDLIDHLRSLGLEKDLSLPAIAVIGDQSSGKSSVLEALSGVSLPRGTGIVTRCPLELKLKNVKEKDVWTGFITYNNHRQELTDPSEVEQEIRIAQDIIAGKGVGISHELISLQIEASNVPDLTLIDLPGIARVAVGKQPLNIGDQIKQLIKSFIEKQETINLVVVPCNVDIATTEALKMAQEVDPSGERTVGILTKPDLVDKGTEKTVVEIIQNQVVELKKGYIVVKCRGQQDINEKLTLRRALEKEKVFFEEHQHFRFLIDEGKASIPCLAKRLTSELVDHIKKINTFGQHVVSLALGEEPETFIQKERCYSKVRKEFQQWKVYLNHALHQFQCDLKNNVCAYERMYRGRELPGFTNYKTFEAIIKQQVCRLEQPAMLKLKNITEIVHESFMAIALHNFNGVPNLLKASKMKMEELKKKQERHAVSQLRIQFKLEDIVYSQDSNYSDNLELKATEEYREQTPDQNSLTSKMSTSKSKEESIQEMSTHVDTYYKIMSDRLADQVPLIIRYYMMQEFASNLQVQMLELLQNRQQIEEYLEEEKTIAEKRRTLKNKLDRLSKAQVHLLDLA
uniref:Interferon-induced GTP-binding protein Mx-like n=1 Tax=Callorhinchus milii TaxID=7868 RepID=A0A4W3JA70_CALMI